MSSAADLMRPIVKLSESCQRVATFRPQVQALQSYLCPAKVWTCGWGSTGKDVGPGTWWTFDYADSRLELDLQFFLTGTLQRAPFLAGMPEVHAAVADWAYNLGLGRLDGSTLLRVLRAQNWDRVKTEILKWRYGGGVVLRGLDIRRRTEVALIDAYLKRQ